MSNCIGCVCNACVYNADLDPQYFTPGEIDNVCFNCDDCMTTNGHSRWAAAGLAAGKANVTIFVNPRKRLKWRPGSPGPSSKS